MTIPDLSPVDAAAASALPAPAQPLPVVPALEPIVWPKQKEDGEPFKLPLPPPKVWEYRLADGTLYGVVARWDRKPKKIVLPCVCIEDAGKVRWAWSGFGNVPGSRPLLGLVELAMKPLATVLLVEGEKARDAAPQYMPPDWVCLTWQGGSKAVKYADWRPLAGRRVVIWPDKDAAPIDPKTGEVAVDAKTGRKKLPAGEETARELMVTLNGIGAFVAQIPVYGPRLAMIPSNGWDLADTLPDGFDPTEWMKMAAAQISVPRPAEARQDAPANVNGTVQGRVEDASGPPDGVDRGIADPDVEYRCLGYSKDGNVPVFHIFSARSGFIITQRTKDLCSETGIYNICNDETWWRLHLDLPRERFEKMPWKLIGRVLMNKCYDAGYFRVDNERGRGAWIDNGRVVMHLGQMLWVDGQPISPAKMISDYYYPVADNLIRLNQAPPLTDAEGRHLRKIFRLLRWKNPFYAELMGGWIATAVICGAMPWRTHFWLQGEAGSGKSWVVENIVKPCFGQLGYYPMGNSSAAGILGTLRRDARPVVFDEAEAGKGRGGSERRDMIIEMLRYSSSEGSGEVVKGTAAHGTVSFRVQSQYFLSSIGVGVSEVADLTRIVVCGLQRPNPLDASFEQLKELVKQLPKNLPERLLRRQLRNLRTIRANAETFAQIIALRIGNRRIGDQIGTLLAGDWSLASDAAVTDGQAEDIVDRRMEQKRFDDFSRINEAKEDADLLDHLASFMVRAQTSRGYGLDRSIGELLVTASGQGRDPDDKLDMVESDTILRRMGLAYEAIDGVPGFWIAKQKTYVANEIMRRSAFAQGWELVLKNHPQARESEKPRGFGGFKLHAIWLPLDVLNGDRREAAEGADE